MMQGLNKLESLKKIVRVDKQASFVTSLEQNLHLIFKIKLSKLYDMSVLEFLNEIRKVKSFINDFLYQKLDLFDR